MVPFINTNKQTKKGKIMNTTEAKLNTVNIKKFDEEFDKMLRDNVGYIQECKEVDGSWCFEISKLRMTMIKCINENRFFNISEVINSVVEYIFPELSKEDSLYMVDRWRKNCFDLISRFV